LNILEKKFRQQIFTLPRGGWGSFGSSQTFSCTGWFWGFTITKSISYYCVYHIL